MSFLHVAVDDGQLRAWKRSAAGRDLSLSAWVRMTLDREAGSGDNVPLAVGAMVRLQRAQNEISRELMYGNRVGTPAGGVGKYDPTVDHGPSLVKHVFPTVFAADCPGTHMAGVRCDGCGGDRW